MGVTQKVDIENYLIHILDDPRLGQQHNGPSGEDADPLESELDADQAQADNEAGADGSAEFESSPWIALVKPTVLDSL